MKYRKVSSVDYFDVVNFNSIINRLDSLKPSAERKWGQMSASQMLHHLNVAIGSGLGYYNLQDESSIFSRGIIQFMILNVLRRFPINVKTTETLKVVEDFDFEIEKNMLREILHKAYETKSNQDWGKHTYFGKMSRKSWGKLIMIHCNHHFLQFSN